MNIKVAAFTVSEKSNNISLADPEKVCEDPVRFVRGSVFGLQKNRLFKKKIHSISHEICLNRKTSLSPRVIFFY